MVKVKSSPASAKVNKRKSAVTIKRNSLGIKKQQGKRGRRRGVKKNTVKEPKGVVYISHIPHGFYEEQIEGYFSQFGKVTGINVPRSKTGRSKGYAFIEYKYPEIAEIAADTMNNYLMLNRLLKAKYIPPKQQKPYIFRKVKDAIESNATLANKTELAIKHNRKVKNRPIKLAKEFTKVKNLLERKKVLASRMKNLGFSPDFEVEDANFQSVIKRKKELDELTIKKSKNQESNSESEEVADESEDNAISSDEMEDDSEEESKSESIAKSLAAAQSILKSAKKKKRDTPLVVKPSAKNSLLDDTKPKKSVTPTGKQDRKSLNKSVTSLLDKTPSSAKKRKRDIKTPTTRKSNVSQTLKEVAVKKTPELVKDGKNSAKKTPKEKSAVKVLSNEKLSTKKSLTKDVITPKVSSPSNKSPKDKKLRHRNMKKVL